MDTSITPQLDYQEVAGFKIWYSDSTYTGTTYKEWTKAPTDDIQVVMIYFVKLDGMGRHTRLYSSGCDYYALTEDLRFTSHFDDTTKVSGHILYGKYTHWDNLMKIEKIAFEDYGEWLHPAEPVVVGEPKNG